MLGGARPPADLPANVVTTYGLTETGSGVVYDGRPLDGVDVRLADDGEVHLRGPMLLRAYRDGVDPKDAEGWLPTGDLGALGADGRLVVHGRRGDLVITGGENVWPDAVEAVLAEHPGVAEVVVAGRPDPEWGQRVVAFVVPTADGTPPDLDGLRAWVKERLPAFCAPRELVLVERIPRTALGQAPPRPAAGPTAREPPLPRARPSRRSRALLARDRRTDATEPAPEAVTGAARTAALGAGAVVDAGGAAVRRCCGRRRRRR